MAEERRRLISPEPRLIPLLRARKTVLLRPYRDVYLSFLEDVCRDLRSREFWVLQTSGTIASFFIGTVLDLILRRR